MPSTPRQKSEKQRKAMEQGRALPFYTKEVAKELIRKKKTNTARG